MIIGVIGKSGIGKSTFIKEFSAFKNYIIFDVDCEVKKLYNLIKVQQDILKILNINIEFDISKIRNILLNDREKMELIEDYFDKIFFNELKEFSHFYENIVIDCAQLLNCKLTKQLVDIFYLLRLDEKIRMKRLIKRVGQEQAILITEYQNKYLNLSDFGQIPYIIIDL